MPQNLSQSLAVLVWPCWNWADWAKMKGCGKVLDASATVKSNYVLCLGDRLQRIIAEFWSVIQVFRCSLPMYRLVYKENSGIFWKEWSTDCRQSAIKIKMVWKGRKVSRVWEKKFARDFMSYCGNWFFYMLVKGKTHLWAFLLHSSKKKIHSTARPRLILKNLVKPKITLSEIGITIY